ncbi:putative O-methyltransferase YrrM [Salinibacter ruber]|uniref:class I SAM-dependent methyltransferase n=1 Tax=Salinibacter ruber TaxID=146919 RepID=UPI002167658B|nr:class I SAM-dependent methyltransferase [Salinibacter ruber]MCS4155850.1 putative O-methyltransferase YrrM [Salinibacter ruber]
MSSPQTVLQSILDSGRVENGAGEARQLRGHIGKPEGELCQELIREHEVSECLEVGCAYGIASLYISEALREKSDPHHTIIDPLELGKWEGIGLQNLEQAGISFWDYIEQGSELALPELVREGRHFDFVLIDGYHTFDHTMIDLFYSTKLLRVGGILALDDANHPPVYKAARYFSEYPCYEKVGATPSKSVLKGVLTSILPLASSTLSFAFPQALVDRLGTDRLIAFQKTNEDDRPWDWYRQF